MKESGYADRSRFIEVLSKSFDVNPGLNWIAKQDRKRKERIKFIINYSYDICNKDGETLITDDKDGVALCCYPHRNKTSYKNSVKLFLRDFYFVLRAPGLSKMWKIVERGEYIDSQHPDMDFLHLWFIGVLPGSQRSGVGTTLMDSVIEMSQSSGLPLYLETTVKENLKFYRKFGLEVFHEWNNPAYDFPIWFLKKE